MGESRIPSHESPSAISPNPQSIHTSSESKLQAIDRGIRIAVIVKSRSIHFTDALSNCNLALLAFLTFQQLLGP